MAEAKEVASTGYDPVTGNTYSILVSEILFVLLPLIVLAIVLSYQKKMFGLLHTPEWSFISAILFGQTLVKVIAAATSSEERPYWQRVVLVAAFIIVLGIVPSLLILTLVLISEPPPIALALAQLALFIVSIGLYFWIGGTMQRVITEREGKRIAHNKSSKRGSVSGQSST